MTRTQYQGGQSPSFGSHESDGNLGTVQAQLCLATTNLLKITTIVVGVSTLKQQHLGRYEGDIAVKKYSKFVRENVLLCCCCRRKLIKFIIVRDRRRFSWRCLITLCLLIMLYVVLIVRTRARPSPSCRLQVFPTAGRPPGPTGPDSPDMAGNIPGPHSDRI